MRGFNIKKVVYTKKEWDKLPLNERKRLLEADSNRRSIIHSLNSYNALINKLNNSDPSREVLTKLKDYFQFPDLIKLSIVD